MARPMRTAPKQPRSTHSSTAPDGGRRVGSPPSRPYSCRRERSTARTSDERPRCGPPHHTGDGRGGGRRPPRPSPPGPREGWGAPRRAPPPPSPRRPPPGATPPARRPPGPGPPPPPPPPPLPEPLPGVPQQVHHLPVDQG